jgi:hypothetical protein
LASKLNKACSIARVIRPFLSLNSLKIIFIMCIITQLLHTD